MSIKIKSGLFTYEFETLRDATKALFQWQDKEYVTDKDIAQFVIQLFHQIPEQLYNDIINND